MSESTADSTTYVYQEEYRPPFLPVLILFPPVLPFFWKYHVRVSDTKLSFGYSVSFQREVQRALIQQAEKVDHINGLTQWGGWGYRLSLQGQVGYISKNGPGIKLTYKETEDGKDIVTYFNCKDADDVCKILNTPVVNAVVH